MGRGREVKTCALRTSREVEKKTKKGKKKNKKKKIKQKDKKKKEKKKKKKEDAFIRKNKQKILKVTLKQV